MENRIVKVAAIKDNPQNARKALERDEGSIARLAADIKVNGLMNPLLVHDLENGGYELRAGSRRLAAVKELGWLEVEVRIAPKDGSRRLRSLAENVDREDLSLYEIAVEVAEVARTEDLSGAQISRATGMSSSHVNNLIRMVTNLPQVIKDDWKAGHPMATRETLGKIAGIVDKETKKPNHAKMIETWNALIGADEDGEDEDGEDEDGGDEGGEDKPKKVNVRANAEKLVALLAQAPKSGADVSAMQCLQYALGTRKTLPMGLKEAKEG